jgi:hypothetical protein
MTEQNTLITPTLLDAYEFAKNAPPSWKARAMNGFISKIRREKVDYPAWVGKGIAFEDTVYRVCRHTQPSTFNPKPLVTQGSKLFKIVANACINGDFQRVFKKTLVIDGTPTLFYCKTDVFFPVKIIDIKTTLNWRGDEKYLNGWQHKLYTWAAGVPDFEYIVAVWEEEHSDKINDVKTITYHADNLEDTEKEIIAGTKEMLAFIHEQGLYEDYFFTFSNNRKR